MKIIFGITSLTIGGAEKVLVDIANKLSVKHEITILTIYSNGELEKNLNKNVKLKSIFNFKFDDLSKLKKQLISLRLLLLKKYYYKRYVKSDNDIEIAFLEGPITRIFGVRNPKVKKIAWIHNDISKVFGNSLKAKIKISIDKKTYGKYRTLIFVSKDNRDRFTEVYKDIRDEYLQPVHKRVVYNYIDPENIRQCAKKKIKDKFNENTVNFLIVARLTKQKRIDRVIEVHKSLIEHKYIHNFYVIGDGPEKQNLEKQIQDNKLQETFHLLGLKENPYPYMKNADFICLLSEFEGYGMVIEEAKILGKPIIITDTAAREAVENYKNSTIVKNTEQGIYSEIRDILKKKIKNFSNEREEYNNEKILQKIEKIIEE